MQLVWWLAWGAEYLGPAAQYLSLAWGPMVTNVVGRPGRLPGPASEHARRNLCQAAALHWVGVRFCALYCQKAKSLPIATAPVKKSIDASHGHHGPDRARLRSMY